MNSLSFGNPKYGITRNLGPVDFAEARSRVEEALKKSGFGVLTEIDVQATMKKKINQKVQPYLILGACNPQIAFQALSVEPAIGLLLPCNVILTQEKAGDVIVSAIQPELQFTVVDRSDVLPLAKQVKELLEKAIQSV